MYGKFKDFLSQELANIEAAGLYKKERIITTPQRANIQVNAGEGVLNFCANNYLGLSDNKRLIELLKLPWILMVMECLLFVSFVELRICTNNWKLLFLIISRSEDQILYAACFDANGGLFEPLFTDEDAIISDSLNHASIIDGVRLCKGKTLSLR